MKVIGYILLGVIMIALGIFMLKSAMTIVGFGLIALGAFDIFIAGTYVKKSKRNVNGSA